MLTRACPTCASDIRRTLFVAGEWDVCRCDACSMVYLPNVPSYDEQVESFTWERTYQAERKRRSNIPLYRYEPRWLRKLRPSPSEVKLRYVLRYRASGALLDYGCGGGDFLALAMHVFRATGIDISPELAKKAATRAPGATIVCAPVTEANLRAGSFDVITMFSYLEHEPQPFEVLQIARDLLSPDGVLMMKTPNYASINRTITGRHWCGYRFPDHCNYFTPGTLRLLLTRAGLTALPGRFTDHLPTSDSMYLAAGRSG
ncbi:MAG: class I SAM-dependent methyltransferase [Armatimonadota bacterium]